MFGGLNRDVSQVSGSKVHDVSGFCFPYIFLLPVYQWKIFSGFAFYLIFLWNFVLGFSKFIK